MDASLLQAALVHAHVAHLSQRDTLRASVSGLAMNLEGELVVSHCLFEKSLLTVEDAQVAQDDALEASISHFAMDGEGRLEVAATRRQLVHLAK